MGSMVWKFDGTEWVPLLAVDKILTYRHGEHEAGIILRMLQGTRPHASEKPDEGTWRDREPML